MKFAKSGITSAVLLSAVLMMPAQPGWAADGTRSADAVPAARYAASGAAPCTPETGKAGTKSKGGATRCSPLSPQSEASRGHFPIYILLGALGLGGVAALLAGGGKSDSPG